MENLSVSGTFQSHSSFFTGEISAKSRRMRSTLQTIPSKGDLNGTGTIHLSPWDQFLIFLSGTPDLLNPVSQFDSELISRVRGYASSVSVGEQFHDKVHSIYKTIEFKRENFPSYNVALRQVASFIHQFKIQWFFVAAETIFNKPVPKEDLTNPSENQIVDFVIENLATILEQHGLELFVSAFLEIFFLAFHIYARFKDIFLLDFIDVEGSTMTCRSGKSSIASELEKLLRDWSSSQYSLPELPHDDLFMDVKIQSSRIESFCGIFTRISCFRRFMNLISLHPVSVFFEDKLNTTLETAQFSLKYLKKLGLRVPPFLKASQIATGDEETAKELCWLIFQKFRLYELGSSQLLKSEISSFGKSIDVYLDYPCDDALNTIRNWFLLACSQAKISFIGKFPESITDISILCQLMAYYVPELMSRDDICLQASSESQCVNNFSNGYYVSNFYPITSDATAERERIRCNRRNLRLLIENARSLGGVPITISLKTFDGDSLRRANGEEYRGFLIFLGFLIFRLLNHKTAVISAKKVQAVWRRHVGRKAERRDGSVLSIQASLQSVLRRNFFKKVLVKINEELFVIQGCLKSHSVRAVFQSSRKNIDIISGSLKSVLIERMMEMKIFSIGIIQASLRPRILPLKLLYITQRKAVENLLISFRCVLSSLGIQSLSHKAKIVQCSIFCLLSLKDRNRFRQAAFVSQAYFRTAKHRVSLNLLKSAILSIQDTFSAVLLSSKVQATKSATLTVKSFCEVYNPSLYIRNIRCSAATLQAVLKSVMKISEFSCKKTSALLIQSYYFARKSSLSVMEMKLKARCIQSGGFSVSFSKNHMQMTKFACVSQASIQAIRNSLNVMYKRFSVEVIQSCLRGFSLASQIRSLHESSLLIQAFAQRISYNKYVSDLVASVKDIQKNLRAWIYQKKFFSLRLYTNSIQRRYRLKKIRRVEHAIYSVKVVQSSFKILFDSHHFKGLKSLVMSIQAFISVYTERKIVHSAGLIQSALLAFAESLLSSKRIKKNNHAAVIIQTISRTSVHNRFYVQHKSAILIARFLKHVPFNSWYSQNRASISAQNWFLSRSLQNRFQCMKEISEHIFSFHKTLEFIRLKGYVICLQSTFSSVRKSSLMNEKLKALRVVSIFAKSACRRRRNSKQNAVAFTIQSALRGYRDQTWFQKYKLSVVDIQGFCLAYGGLSYFRQYFDSVVIMQSFLNGFLSSSSVSRYHETIKVIQSSIRTRVDFAKIFDLRKNTVAIKSSLQAIQSRSEYISMRNSRSLIISSLLSIKESHIVSLKSKSSGVVQSAFLSIIASKSDKRVISSTLFLQGFFSSTCDRIDFLARKVYAKIVQSWIFTSGQRLEFLLLKEDVVGIQASLFQILQSRIHKESYKRVNSIQAALLSALLAQQMRQKVNAALIISGSHAPVQFRKIFFSQKTSSLKIQVAMSSFLSVKKIKVQVEACELLAAGFTSARFRIQRRNIFCLQAAFASIKLAKTFQASRLSLIYSKAAITIARSWIRYKRSVRYMRRKTAKAILSRWISDVRKAFRIRKLEMQSKIIQSTLRSWLLIIDFERSRLSIIRCQSVARGYLLRKKSTPRMKRIRLRFLRATRTWTPEKTLSFRMKCALDVLVYGKHLTNISGALKELDLLTEVLEDCCVSAAESGAIPVMYSLLESLNRSQPHQELAMHCLQILLHLAKCSKTCFMVYEPQSSAEFWIQELQVFHKEETLLFRSLQIIYLGVELNKGWINVKQLRNFHVLYCSKFKIFY